VAGVTSVARLPIAVTVVVIVVMIAVAAWVVRWVGWAFSIRRYDGSQYDPCDTSA
jgi:hypothetical protein